METESMLSTGRKKVELNKWYKIIIEQISINGKVYFIVTIDGKEIRKVENKDPMTFQDVKVFAGDKFLPAADVAYNNLTWDIVSEKEGGKKEEKNQKKKREA